jgi:hypothetical protein
LFTASNLEDVASRIQDQRAVKGIFATESDAGVEGVNHTRDDLLNVFRLEAGKSCCRRCVEFEITPLKSL